MSKSPICCKCGKEKEGDGWSEKHSRCRSCHLEQVNENYRKRMDNAGKAPKRIGKSPNCYWCGALKENPKNGLCNSCKALEARQNRAKKRAEKGLAPHVPGKNPNCGKCGGEKSNSNSYYCTKCASIQRKEAVKKRKEAGLPSYDYSRSPNCYSCGKIKENVAKGYCLECRRTKERESTLKKGIIKNHRKGTCSICHTDWVHKRSCDCIEKCREKRKLIRERGDGHIFFTKESARRKLNRAIQSGIILKSPCIICGAEKSEGHHIDYSKPLEVVWLCRSHHSAIHSYKSNNQLQKKISDILVNKNKIQAMKNNAFSELKKIEEKFLSRLKKLEDKEKELDENCRILKNIKFLWTIEKNQDRSMSVEQILNVLSSQEASIL